MTDKEIIQALRLCSCETSTRNCPTCPLSGNDDCVTDALREAADIIERLTAENAALREKQRWIPVTERLPKTEIDVLIVCNRNGYRFVTPAIHEDGKMLTQDSVWNWNEIYTYGLYSEEAEKALAGMEGKT